MSLWFENFGMCSALDFNAITGPGAKASMAFFRDFHQEDSGMESLKSFVIEAKATCSTDARGQSTIAKQSFQ